jgi:thymidylate synthase
MIVFEGNSASEVWRKAYDYLSMNGIAQEGRTGTTMEIMKASFSILNSRNRWVMYRKPMISPAFAIAEVFWILDGRSDADFINSWNPILKKYAGNVKKYYGAYGERLIHNFGFNQIEKAYETLKYNRDSRQVVLDIWDPTKDLPNNRGIPNSDDIPCNLVSMLKIRNNKLEWSQIMRGNDLLRGTPYNFIQFTMLQEIIAGWLDIDIGDYFLFSDSLHIYKDDLKKFSLRKNIKLTNNEDKLLFSKREFDIFFPECINILQKARLNGIDLSDIKKLEKSTIIPKEYKTLISIPLSYIALKNNDLDLVSKLENLCLNQQLLHIWQQWKKEIYLKKANKT